MMGHERFEDRAIKLKSELTNKFFKLSKKYRLVPQVNDSDDISNPSETLTLSITYTVGKTAKDLEFEREQEDKIEYTDKKKDPKLK